MIYIWTYGNLRSVIYVYILFSNNPKGNRNFIGKKATLALAWLGTVMLHYLSRILILDLADGPTAKIMMLELLIKPAKI
ncbi:hypothetical protein RIF29_21744 [Crotalaria pallida]|uniref:Uncharacterized protein n=1 Tax=Crotalaria pallida TaxID=3830 RepID=A0AAN9F5A1_CROPI